MKLEKELIWNGNRMKKVETKRKQER